ncbi:MAG: hypothetical protein K0S74_1147 [Chlamydiales bacterium]|jgi:uncharacterized membrane protein YccC|nr:hypothetical protein [Chlamydiales bacterium]
MNTITITTTTTVQNGVSGVLHLTPVVPLTLREQVLAKLKALWEEMQQSSLVNQEDQEAIEQWMAEFEQDYAPHIAESEEKSEDAAWTLAYFLIKLIQPLIIKNSGSHNLEQLSQILDWEDAIRSMIQLLLSSQEDIDRIIKGCEEDLAIEEQFLSEYESLENDFQKAIKAIYDKANASNEEILHTFEALKGRVLKIAKAKENALQESSQRLGALAHKIEQVLKDTRENVQKVHNLSEQMGKLYQKSDDLKPKAKALFKGL